MIELLDPTVEAAKQPIAYVDRPGSLKGKRIGLIENTKYNSDKLLVRIGEILKAAGSRDASLIVMGVHGRNPIERLFFGSTALHVLRQARCPVWIVRAPARRTRDAAA